MHAERACARLRRTLITLAMVLVTGNTYAGLLTPGSTITFGGDLTPVNGLGFDVSNFNDAVGVDILGDDAVVLSATHSFDSVPDDGTTFAIFRDFGFRATPSSTLPLYSQSGFAPQWEVGGFSFHMIGLTSMNISSSGNSIELTGIGTVLGAGLGFDPTDGTWAFSSNAVFGNRFSFSAETVAVPAPLGASLMISVFGALIYGRRLRKRALKQQ